MRTKNIVLLHGWGANAGKLKNLSLSLKKLGWNTYAPQLPGFERPIDHVYTLKDYSGFVARESAKYFNGKDYIVFGHSFGGRISIGLSKYYPKRIYGIVLCSAGGISRPYIIKRILFSLLAKIGKLLNIFPKIANFFRRILYKAAREHDYEKLNGFMRETFQKVVSENLKKDSRKIKLPALILWGKKDKMTPFKDALFLSKYVKKSTLIKFEDQGHKLPYIKPSEISLEIDLWYKRTF